MSPARIPRLYGLRKLHKNDRSIRPAVSYVLSPTYLCTFYRLFEEKVSIGLPLMEEVNAENELSLRFEL